MRAIGICALAALGACAARSAPSPAPAPTAAPAPVAFGDDAAMARYHSKRLALSLPLPSGRQWAIDDHTSPELVLRHAPTQSTIVVAVLRSDGLVGRTQCEALAAEDRLLPKGDVTWVEDEVMTTQEHYDTHVRVGFAPGPRADSPLAGYVVAFGGYLRKCFVFTFSTMVDRAADEPVLSSRLAFARTRIFGGLKLDAFASVPRDVPGGAPPP